MAEKQYLITDINGNIVKRCWSKKEAKGKLKENQFITTVKEREAFSAPVWSSKYKQTFTNKFGIRD